MKRITFLITFFVFITALCHAQSIDDEKYEQASSYYEAKEYEKAFPILKELADKDHAKALNLLGVCYDFGRGVDQDITKSVELYKRSADLGYARAKNNLGSCYQYGDGVPKDLIKAYDYYIKAANQQDSLAQINLGWLFQDEDFLQILHPKGDWKEFSFLQSEKWFRMAAKQGVPKGYYGLGCIYDSQLDNGNIGKAYELYKKAADMGYYKAQAEMAFICFCHGEMDKARAWFIKADKNGAMNNSLVVRGFKYELIKTIFDFFCRNKQYTYNGMIETYDYNIFLEGNNIYVGINVVEKGTSVFLKLVQKGSTLSMMPGLYEYYYDNDNDVMRFKELK